MTPAVRERGTHPFPVWICYAVIAIGMAVLLWFEIGKPTLSDDPVLQPIITMTLTRAVGAAVFLCILLWRGYRVLNPLRRPFLKSLAFSLPAWMVVINNAPILSLAWGDAFLTYTAPAYILWFCAECLSIGLFEELAFRGVILLSLAENRHATRFDLFRCILLTSAVFGAVHLANLFAGAGVGAVIRQIGYSFLIGAMCAVVLYKTANLWLCVLLHAVYDFAGDLVPSLGGGSWWDTPTVIFTVLLAVAVTVYFVAALWRMNPAALERIYASGAGSADAAKEQKSKPTGKKEVQ